MNSTHCKNFRCSDWSWEVHVRDNFASACSLCAAIRSRFTAQTCSYCLPHLWKGHSFSESSMMSCIDSPRCANQSHWYCDYHQVEGIASYEVCSRSLDSSQIPFRSFTWPTSSSSAEDLCAPKVSNHWSYRLVGSWRVDASICLAFPMHALGTLGGPLALHRN